MIDSVVSHKRASEVFQGTVCSLKKGMQNSMAFTTHPYEILLGVVAVISIYMMNLNFRSFSAPFTNFKFTSQANINWSKFFAVLIGTVFSFVFVATFSRAILTMFARAIPEVTTTSSAGIKKTLSHRWSSSRRIITLSTAKPSLSGWFLYKYFPTLIAFCLFIFSKKSFQVFMTTFNTAIFRPSPSFVRRFDSFISFIAPLTVFANSHFLRFGKTRFGAIFRVFARDPLKLSSALITNKYFHLSLRS